MSLDCHFCWGLDNPSSKELYWHLRREHSMSHDQAFEAVGEAMDASKRQEQKSREMTTWYMRQRRTFGSSFGPEVRP